ncbi:MAG: hypothetical protein R3250_16880 [Melioribacteraceae bacterium]|nr:hypothetical protein [Melioribacteraceae bacterium]
MGTSIKSSEDVQKVLMEKSQEIERNQELRRLIEDIERDIRLKEIQKEAYQIELNNNMKGIKNKQIAFSNKLMLTPTEIENKRAENRLK